MSDRDMPLGRVLERAIRLPSRVIARGVLDLLVTGREHLPSGGSVVIAANHFSHLDVPIIGTNVDRYVRFLAVDELYGKSRVLDATMSAFGAIPLDRDGYPVHALRTAMNHLIGGHAVGVFPEGRRVEAWGVDPPRRGAAWLAWASGAPLVPVAIHGTQDSMGPANRGFSRTAVRMWIDEPLWWYDYTARVFPLQAMMDDWFDRVNDHLAPWAASSADDGG
jgi:1-acyl-sn-glycerol-3-phosphate acyltransferase